MDLDLIVDTSRKGMRLFMRSKDNAIAKELVYLDAKSEKLEQMLDQLLYECNATLDNVKRVLVLLGPGSFTGLRTGIAFCEGLCFSGKRKLYGISTLKALSTFANEDSYVIIKARKGYWYFFNETKESTQSEYFWPTACVVEAIMQGDKKSAVIDSFVLQDESIMQALNEKNVKIVEESNKDLAQFAQAFDFGILPSLIQEANYIQPSYAEQSAI